MNNMAGEDSSSSLCKTTSGQFRWLLFLRFTVALVVTVAAAVVVVRGLRLVLRPGDIQLNIPQGKVFVSNKANNKTTDLSFKFYMEATNPSEIIILYYRDIRVKLYNSTARQGEQQPSLGNVLATFEVNASSSLSLFQKTEQEYLVSADMGSGVLSELRQPFQIDNATMVLNGVLGVANAKQPLINPTTYHAKFTCYPVSVTYNDTLPKPLSDESNKAYCQQKDYGLLM